jgi:hypothetical protein
MPLVVLSDCADCERFLLVVLKLKSIKIWSFILAVCCSSLCSKGYFKLLHL